MVNIWFMMVDIWLMMVDIWLMMVNIWLMMVDIWLMMVDIWLMMVNGILKGIQNGFPLWMMTGGSPISGNHCLYGLSFTSFHSSTNLLDCRGKPAGETRHMITAWAKSSWRQDFHGPKLGGILQAMDLQKNGENDRINRGDLAGSDPA